LKVGIWDLGLGISPKLPEAKLRRMTGPVTVTRYDAAMDAGERSEASHRRGVGHGAPASAGVRGLRGTKSPGL